MKACDVSIIERTREDIAKLAMSRRGPILVGPWLSEVGFELLYWIPFLRWAVTVGGLKREDLWIVSRGGCQAWYADIAAHYVDIFDTYTPEQFRAGNKRRVDEQALHAESLGLRHGRSSAKQHMVTGFDREIITRVTRQICSTDVRILHPSVMYRLFRPFWIRQAPELYAQMTRPQEFARPEPIAGLPASYVAAKFYASAACPLTPINVRMVNDAVKAVAATTDVVLLTSRTRYDDHGEFPIQAHPRVHTVKLTPATNLATQTAVIAHARSYLGTYGGFAYLAPFLRVPARTFYTAPNFRRDHRDVLAQVSKALGVSFAVDFRGGR